MACNVAASGLAKSAARVQALLDMDLRCAAGSPAISTMCARYTIADIMEAGDKVDRKNLLDNALMVHSSSNLGHPGPPGIAGGYAAGDRARGSVASWGCWGGSSIMW